MHSVVYFVFFFSVFAENQIRFETFTGEPISAEEFKQYEEANNTFWCTGQYKPCNASEGRRLDLSCNNLNYPTRGMPQTPYINELPQQYGEDNEPVKTKSGEKMPLARKVRTKMLSEGSIPDQKFTILFVHYLLFASFGNDPSTLDAINYSVVNTHCCQPEGRTDDMCAPIRVPADDTVHQFSGIRCFNMTKPLTFQSQGCIRNDERKPERMNDATVFMDLRVVYGLDDTYRSLEDGMLQVEKDNEKIWPISGNEFACMLNIPPKETRCNKKPDTNIVIGINFLTILFWRLHNYFAEELKILNPCWDDEKLFYHAREINIAHFVQIYYYEAMQPFLGEKYLREQGLISSDDGFRDIYDENLVPQLAKEYTYILRWGHTIQPGYISMYDPSGNYQKQVPVGNLTLRTGFLPLDQNMEGITQGVFRQPAAKFDHIVDPYIAQTALPGLQKAFDLPSADLAKGSLQGMASYVAYRKLCTGKNYSTFEDLAEDMEPQYIEMLGISYKHVEDVPLMAGVWLEKMIPGGNAPRTLACLTARQMKRFIQYDRHWYERPNRPNAFTKEQLQEIRKATISRVMCDVGDSVTEIQPNAFLRNGPEWMWQSAGHIAHRADDRCGVKDLLPLVPGSYMDRLPDAGCWKPLAANGPKLHAVEVYEGGLCLAVDFQRAKLRVASNFVSTYPAWEKR